MPENEFSQETCMQGIWQLRRRRKNQQMTQVKMFIHNRLTQHISGIIMTIVRRTDCIQGVPGGTDQISGECSLC